MCTMTSPIKTFLEVNMLTIKVLGPGCPNCKKVEAIAKQAVQMMGVEAEITKVTDYSKIMDYNIMSTPGLAVNGVVKSTGRVLSPEAIKGLLQ